MIQLRLWRGGAAFLVVAWAAVAGASDDRPGGAPEELLVGLRPGVTDEALETILSEQGATRTERLHSLRVHRVRAPRGLGKTVKAKLELRAEIEFVEHDQRVAPDTTPNDPQFPYQWALPRIAAPAVWDITTGHEGVAIAIIDSGVDPTHPDLASKLLPGWNFYDGNANSSDVFGHGTKVAGAGAAIGNNALGVAGVAWRNPILPIRVADTSGYAYFSTIAQGLTWAADHGARVMNVSFASVAGSSTIRAAAQYVQDRAGLVIAAAGNCGCDDPTAENPYLLSVAATDGNDLRAGFSSRGSYVDIAAPGTGIWTTFPGGGYGIAAGTSISSPIVAGVVALMWSVNPELSPDQIVFILEDTATDFGTVGHDTSFGFGRVQAELAVAAAGSATSDNSPSDTVPPAASIQTPTVGATLSGSAIVEVVAFDDRAVTHIDLYVDHTLVGRDVTSPFSFAWDTRLVPDGSHRLVAVASDASGNQSASSPVDLVTINSRDTSPPVASIVSPTDGSAVSRFVSIIAKATDDSSLSRIDVLIDGKVLGGTDCTESSCVASLRWNARKVPKGRHEIRARAVDAGGNQAMSAPVAVFVGG